ncbi:glycosyltransferase [Micromonospora pisi]|uniref:glycosyltransferase n=1 Tax=Micromonospora pisi TaxID=589240 RepID=UPI001B87E4EC|nr:glycosyltransferase [Micromonospora pisi]
MTIAVGTYGNESWRQLAETRAIPSAQAFGVPVVHVHADSLHSARNGALAQVATEWVVHLDADDELEPGYLDAMAAGTADLRAPAVRYVHGRRVGAPGLPRVAGHLHICHAGCLPHGNWLVVGTAVRTGLVRAVGGWWDEPLYEDWSLWLRCWAAGATVEAIPRAVYRAHVRRGSRNRAPSMVEKNRVHHQIVKAVLG